jgi:hypothetical protein
MEQMVDGWYRFVESNSKLGRGMDGMGWWNWVRVGLVDTTVCMEILFWYWMARVLWKRRPCLDGASFE